MLKEEDYCHLNGDRTPADYPVLLPFPQPADLDPPAPAVVIKAEPVRPVVVYVSGPYRDARGTWYVEQNIRKAEAYAVVLWRQGFAVICPHMNTKHMDGIIEADQFIRGDLELVRRSDVVMMIPGWRNSLGAVEEQRAAVVADVLVLEADRFADMEAMERIRLEGRAAVAAIKKERAGVN